MSSIVVIEADIKLETVFVSSSFGTVCFPLSLNGYALGVLGDFLVLLNSHRSNGQRETRGKVDLGKEQTCMWLVLWGWFWLVVADAIGTPQTELRYLPMNATRSSRLPDEARSLQQRQQQQTKTLHSPTPPSHHDHHNSETDRRPHPKSLKLPSRFSPRLVHTSVHNGNILNASICDLPSSTGLS